MNKRKRRFKKRTGFKKKVLKAIRLNTPEVKLYQPPTGALVADATGDVLVVPFLMQGIAENQRIGNKIRMKRVTYRFQVSASLTANAFDQQNVRFMIVQDKDPVSGATPGVNTILETATMYSVKAQASRRRFVIHHDRICSVSKLSNEDRREKFCTGSLSLKNRYQKYTGSANTTQTNGNWYVVVFGNNPTAIALDNPVATGYLQLFYTDA